MKLRIMGAAILLLAMAVGASAAEFIAPSGTDGTVSLPQTEQHRNLYLAGGSVTVNSNTLGDLSAAGGSVTISGAVEQDLNVAGGNINLNGAVGGDLRAGGGNLSINSPIAGDALIAGGSVTISEKAAIGADLVAAGGTVTVDSAVTGNAKIAGGTVTINGTIKGNVEVRAEQKLVFGPNSKVTGTIVYKGPIEAEVRPGAQVGTIQFTKVEKNSGQNDLRVLFTIATLIKLLGLFIASLLLAHFYPIKTQAALTRMHTEFWPSFGIGLLVLFLTPVAGILLLITGIGIYLAIALFSVYLLLLVSSAIMAPFYIGALIRQWINKAELKATWQNMIIGLIFGTIIAWIPILGWLIVGIVFILAAGALVRDSLPARMRS